MTLWFQKNFTADSTKVGSALQERTDAPHRCVSPIHLHSYPSSHFQLHRSTIIHMEVSTKFFLHFGKIGAEALFSQTLIYFFLSCKDRSLFQSGKIYQKDGFLKLTFLPSMRTGSAINNSLKSQISSWNIENPLSHGKANFKKFICFN